MKTLRPYQRGAVDQLKALRRANLYADMGLGKTLIVLQLIHEMDLDRVLIVAPKKVCEDTWPREAASFPNMNMTLLLGDESTRLAGLLTLGRITVINYDNVKWLIKLLGADWPFEMVVCDESTRLKGFRPINGRRAARALATHAGKTQRWLNLTGTPSPNGLLDLWGQHWYIDGGRALGRTYSSFQQRWFYREATGRQNLYAKLLPFPNAQKDIEERIKPTTISIRAKDHFPVEEPIFIERYVTLPDAARREYRRMERQLFMQLKDGTVTAANAAVKSGKLLQMANGFIYPDPQSHAYETLHGEKLDALASIAEESWHANLLVAYQYTADAKRICERFSEAVMINDPGAIERWNKGEIRLLLAHPKSAGHGLNLQHGGSRLVFFGQTWDLEQYLQILERIGPVRQKQSGYDRSVFVYSILARDTIDEAVALRRNKKGEVMESLLDSMRQRFD